MRLKYIYISITNYDRWNSLLNELSYVLDSGMRYKLGVNAVRELLVLGGSRIWFLVLI